MRIHPNFPREPGASWSSPAADARGSKPANGVSSLTYTQARAVSVLPFASTGTGASSPQARAVSNSASSRLQARSACASWYTAESGGHQPCRVPA